MKAFFVNMPDDEDPPLGDPTKPVVTPKTLDLLVDLQQTTPIEHHVLCCLALELPLAWKASVQGRSLFVTEPISLYRAELTIVPGGKG